jgi:hypothetical protein
MDVPSDGAHGPLSTIRNWFQDPTVFNAVNRLKKYNYREERRESLDFKRGGTALS